MLLIALFSLIFTVGIAASEDASAVDFSTDDEMAKDSSEGDISAFRSAMEEDGFIVQEGNLSYFDIIGL